MEIISIKNNEIDLKKLASFIENLGEASEKFRYFEKRNLNTIQNHITTLLVINEEKAVGYGHLDKEGNDVWLGIAITPNSQGKGIGKMLMKALIKHAKKNYIYVISLTVDKDNYTAQRLYEKFNFKKSESLNNSNFYKYHLAISNE